jgi:hypothetical protein
MVEVRSGLALLALALLSASPVNASGVGKPIVFNGKGFATRMAVICVLTLVLMVLVVYHRDLKCRANEEKPQDLTLRILHEDEELDAPGSHSSHGSKTKDVGVMSTNPSFANLARQRTMESFSQ